jgi:replication factor A1
VSDFEALAGKLLKSRPELTREELMTRIAQKKETVGAGYLTDQGALFLVAGELGVNLQPAVSSDLSLKDLHIGANDITIVARVLAVYPTTTYNKKDGGSGKYRRLVLFDKGVSSRLTIWDDNVEDPDKLGITAGSALRVVSGYVKQGLDGKPNLNLGKKGKLELVQNAKLPTLDDVSEKLTKVTAERPVIALDCTVTSEPRYSEFVRSDGSPGSLYQFGVGAQAGKEQQRLVIWGPSSRPELRPGDRVRVTNLRFKRTSRGDFELHGDSGSSVVQVGGREASELRIAAISATATGSLIFGLDKDKMLRVVETQLDTAQFKPGDAIAVSPDQESGGRMVCRSPGSMTKAEAENVPSLDQLAVKVKDVKDETSQIMVEVIALSHGTVDDVDMRDGTNVKKGELMVGDDTGEIKVVGWREYSSKVAGIQPGERLRIVGLSPRQTKMGAWTLQVSPLTAIEKLKARA